MVSFYLFVPLAAALIYTLGSILIKRALMEGATMGQIFHLTNGVLGVVFLPLLLVPHDPVDWGQVVKPVLMGVTFFLGLWLTFIALQKGDVSLVTPILGTKVVFVALGVALLMRETPSPVLWVAALLTTGGILLMGFGDMRKGARLWFSVGVSLASALIFGLCDVLVSWWGEAFGGTVFLPIGFCSIGWCSLLLWLCQGRPTLRVPPGAKTWTVWAAAMIGLQAMLMGVCLTYFHDATGINIVYASRGIWAIVLLLLFGQWLGVVEHRANRRAFIWRSVGALILTVAIVLAVIEKSRA